MTLSFSTKWPERMGELAGKPNLFTNKIVKGLWEFYPNEEKEFIESFNEEKWDNFDRINPFEELSVYQTEQLFPKLQTIRQDPSNRWRPGMDIHMVINNRTKKRFQFAPVVKCVGVQEIEIYNGIVLIDDNVFFDPWFDKHLPKASEKNKMKTLAINDGFDSVEDFFAYFNKDFKGKIIHWTDLKY